MTLDIISMFMLCSPLNIINVTSLGRISIKMDFIPRKHNGKEATGILHYSLAEMAYISLLE